MGEYAGYLDDATTYRMTYYTTWIDFGNPVQKSILKKIRLTAIGGSEQSVIFKWGYDFNEQEFSETVSIPALANAATYNVSEYNTTAEYSSGVYVNRISANGMSQGQVVQLGFETEINEVEFSVQKIDALAKNGRI